MESLSRDERSKLTAMISERVERRLGIPERAVIRAAVECVMNNFSKNETAKELATLVDKELSETLSDDMHLIISNFLKKKKLPKSHTSSRKRKHEVVDEASIFDEQEKETKITKKVTKSSIKSRHDEIEDRSSRKEKKSEKSKSLNKSKKETDDKEITSVINTLKKQIEDRKITIASAISSGKMLTIKDLQQRFIQQLSGKSQQAAILQAEIQNKMAERASGLMKDKISIDDTKTENTTTSDGGNTAADQSATDKDENLGLKTVASSKKQAKLSHFDQRVKSNNTSLSRKMPKSFALNEPGKFVKMAKEQRMKEKLEKLQQQIQSNAKKTGIASAAKLAMVTVRHDSKPHNVPQIEWWDSLLLPYDSYAAFFADLKEVGGDYMKMKNKFVGVNKLVEHPIERQPPDDPDENAPLPIYLTKKEQKKIRKQKRRLKELEKQEKIRVGLMPPPPPKVKLSNIMRVLGTEQVQDPTKVEAHIREQIALRIKTHEEANAERKLTDEQRRAKKIKKMKEDSFQGLYVSVYRVYDLTNPSKKFKVDKNAHQLFLTGCILLMNDMNLIIAEAGPKAHSKFKRLMLSRIKWDEDIIGNCATHADRMKPKNETSKPNKCELLWEDWKIKQVTTESVARDFLKKHSYEHIWDLAYTLSLDTDRQNLNNDN